MSEKSSRTASGAMVKSMQMKDLYSVVANWVARVVLPTRLAPLMSRAVPLRPLLPPEHFLV